MSLGMVFTCLFFGSHRKSEIEYYAMLAKTGVHHYSGNNIELGTACGKYYRVCTLAIIDPGMLSNHKIWFISIVTHMSFIAKFKWWESGYRKGYPPVLFHRESIRSLRNWPFIHEILFIWDLGFYFIKHLRNDVGPW